MAFSTISIGAAANDNTGDKPRVAGNKINANFVDAQAQLDGKQPLAATLTALAARTIGVAAGTSILDRDAGDGRFAALSHTHTASQISDSTSAGRSLLTAASAAAQTALLSVMGGASVGAAGTKGLVPAPAAGDQAKFLRGDGTWQTVSGGGGGAVDSVAGRTGTVVLTSADMTDRTTVGANVFTAANQAAGRSALGLGSAAVLSSGAFAAAAHTHPASEISDSTAAGRGLLTATDTAAQRTALALGTAATLNVPAAGDAAVGEVVKGNDTRLTNARAADITGLTAADPSPQTDKFPFYDTSASANRKASLSRLFSGFNERVRHWFTDFLNNSALEIGLVSSNIGTGTATTIVAGETNAVGLVAQACGTQSSGRTSLSTATNAIRLGGGVVRYVTRVRLSALSDGTDRFTVRIGFDDKGTGSGAATNAVGFRAVDNENSGNWRAVCRANSAETTIDSAIAPVTSGWVTLAFEVNEDASSVQFWIDGTSLGSITTNIPNIAGREVGINTRIEKSIGTNSRTLYTDLIAVSVEIASGNGLLLPSGW